KVFSRNFRAGLHYPWSRLMDDVTDVFLVSSTSEFSRAQNSFDRRADRGRSGYDRPHRLTGNFVYELPFYPHQTGATGKLLGGWQLTSIFTFQTGAPFTVMLGSDPFVTATPIRPSLNTRVDQSLMMLLKIWRAGATKRLGVVDGGECGENAGRNFLRSDGIIKIDFGIINNTRSEKNGFFQLRADIFNAFNTRNFGVP